MQSKSYLHPGTASLEDVALVGMEGGGPDPLSSGVWLLSWWQWSHLGSVCPKTWILLVLVPLLFAHPPAVDSLLVS